MSPPVNKIEFGAQEASKFFAESTDKYLFDLSWSSQFSKRRIKGLIIPIKIDKYSDNFSLSNKNLINVKILIIPRPNQIENA